MKKLAVILCIGISLIVLSQCNKAMEFPDDGYDTRLSGGAATTFDATSKAFTHPVDGLSARDLQIHELGDASFEQSFVSAPAPINSGLGPVFNKRKLYLLSSQRWQRHAHSGFQQFVFINKN